MKNRILSLSLFLLGTLGLHAQERHTIHLTDGTIYENAKIIQNSSVELVVSNDEGVFTVKKEQLNTEDQKKFGYDATAADAETVKRKESAEAIKAEKEKLRQKSIQAEAMRAEEAARYVGAERIEFIVSRVRDDGLIVNDVINRSSMPSRGSSGVSSLGGSAGPAVRPPPVITSKDSGNAFFFISGYPMAGIVDNTLITGFFKKSGTYTYEAKLGGKRTVIRYEYVGEGLQN